MTNTAFTIENGILTKYTGKEETVTIPAGVRKIGRQAFVRNLFVRRVEIPSGVESICDSAFYNCHNLTDVKLPNSLKKIGEYAFTFCFRLREIELPENLKLIDQCAFRNCTRLAKVNIPEKATVWGGAFHRCVLTDVDFGSREDFSNIVDGGLRAAASRCVLCGSKLTPAGDCSGMHCPACNNTFSWESMEEWENFVIEDRVCTRHICHGGLIPHGVTKISMGTFDDHVVADLTIPDSVTEIGVGAFLWCEFALSLRLPGYLRRLESNVLCGSNVRWLPLPDRLEYLGERSLSGCDCLTALEIPDSVRVISQRAMVSCDGLQTLRLGAGVRYLGEEAFARCKVLKEVACPKDLEIISACAFQNSEDLRSVSLNQGLLVIGANAFEGCKQLTSVKIPETVLSIEVGAFRKCSALQKVLLPESLRYIDLEKVFDPHTEIEFYAA